MLKYSSLIAFIFLTSCSSTDPEEEKRRYKKAEHMVHEAMEMMDLPEYGVKLARKGLYTSKILFRHQQT